jgi:hypothetical protein
VQLMNDLNTQSLSMAMHQPNYIPWSGYFAKMLQADVFVYLDAVQYPRGRSFSARNRIKASSGTVLLTVPVSVPSGQDGKATYVEVKFADDKWRSKHLRSIQSNYGKAPYFEEVFELIEMHILEAQDLVDLNIGIIESIADYLEIENSRRRLSELLSGFGNKSQLIVDICEAVGANVYLSGTGGGLEYNDESLLTDSNIELRYSEFQHPRYPQLWGEFEANLSMIDMLFNCGRDSRRLLLPGSTESES